MFCLICVCINGWVNNREAGDLRPHRGHYDVNVMHVPMSAVTRCQLAKLDWNKFKAKTQIYYIRWTLKITCILAFRDLHENRVSLLFHEKWFHFLADNFKRSKCVIAHPSAALYMPRKVWDEITNPFPNLNGASIEVRECNFTPHFIMDTNTYLWWDLS